VLLVEDGCDLYPRQHYDSSFMRRLPCD